MFTKEQLIEELKNKSKTQIAKEHDITRKKVLQLEKELDFMNKKPNEYAYLPSKTYFKAF